MISVSREHAQNVNRRRDGQMALRVMPIRQPMDRHHCGNAAHSPTAVVRGMPEFAGLRPNEG